MPSSKAPPFDRRVTPARDDLAAMHLKGRVDAPRFVEGRRHQVRSGVAGMRPRPDGAASLDTQLLFGETIQVYDKRDGWAWGQSELDDYVGYVQADDLSDRPVAPNRRVSALRTFVFPKADIKSPVVMALSMGAAVACTGGDQGRFCALSGGGFVVAQHLAAPEQRVDDYVAVAERFLGVPYLWGGRESQGIDCSGLVQVSLASAGLAAPRDSDLQAKALGHSLGADPANTELRRGDLIFWRGHVAIMIDGDRMIHANATHMAVSIDPLRTFAARVEAETGPVTDIRRLDKFRPGQ